MVKMEGFGPSKKKKMIKTSIASLGSQSCAVTASDLSIWKQAKIYTLTI